MNMQNLEQNLMKMTRYNDILLALLVVAIIALMILPLPTYMVDALIACNLGIAVALLMLSLYIPSALSLSTFPTLLLFTTLFRLALNITTTRQILLYADAGKIIDTFGQIVVAGNFIVGAIIFLIITIVQFMVIAKGAERVAEVGARFTLDAMPGKQMSIDADLRAGTIEMDEAKRRRANVEKESQLYGAMDGAMKFVKGDAIAGLIVTAVNILGGVTIGVIQKQMTAGAALQKFSVLTIGDGLISQIPALFISITAGVIVTRVSTEDSPHLGGDIGTQVLAQPKALTIGGLILLAFALIPGFPKLPFIVLGSLVGGVGYALYRNENKLDDEPEESIPGLAPSGQKTQRRKESDDGFSTTVPLMVDVAGSLKKTIQPERLNEELKAVRRALYLDLGVPFPGIHLRFNDQLSDEQYTILLQEIPIAEGHLPKNRLFVRDRADNLNMLGVPFESGAAFLPGHETLWVENKYQGQLESAGVPFLETTSILTFHLSFILNKHADDFIGLQETRFLLDEMEDSFSMLVKEVQRVLPITKITEVFQRLVQEEISIRNLRNILQSLIEWGQKEKDVVLLTEYVRTSLKRYISHKYSGGQNILASYMFDPDVEETIRKAIRQTSGGSYLALDPETSRRIVEKVKAEVGDIKAQATKPVLLLSMDIRRYVKKMIEMDLGELPVLSYQELTSDITVQPLGRIYM